MTAAGEGVASVLLDFAESAENWDSLVATNASRANPVFDHAHALAKSLRLTQEGREGMEQLTQHAALGVRLLAATECLAWASDIAIPVLEKIEGEPGLHAVTAKYTLKSYRAGTLNLDW